MLVVKNDGSEEKFDRSKLMRSILEVGVEKTKARAIVDEIIRELDPDGKYTTEQIYRMTLGKIHLYGDDFTERIRATASYSIKQAVSSLGPTGFYFERLIEAIFQSYGYITERGVRMMGGSGVDHEIDVVARNNKYHELIEAKYKNQPGLKVRVDVVMYSWARSMDIEEYQRNVEEDSQVTHRAWIVTNNKFTANSIKYAKYKDVRLLGWKYPRSGGIESLIKRKKIYPVTCLPSVMNTIDWRNKLMDSGVVIVRDLMRFDERSLADATGLPPNAAFSIINEADALLKD